jgi:hypothetical protein
VKTISVDEGVLYSGFVACGCVKLEVWRLGLRFKVFDVKVQYKIETSSQTQSV